MQFTTPTEIARKGSKIFTDLDQAIVLNHNKNIGLLLGGKLAEALLESGVLDQLQEELYELNDLDTLSAIKDYKDGKTSGNIKMSDFRRKYSM